MQTLESLKRKIESARDLQSVVRTMRTLAAVNIRQYEAAVESLTDYSRTVDLGIAVVLWSSGETAALRQASEEPGVGALVFGSDQGMCGQFNEQIANYSTGQMRSLAPDPGNRSYMAMGGRLIGRLQDAGIEVEEGFEVPGAISGLTPTVQEMLPRIERWRREHRLGRIMLFYNRRISAAAYEPTRMQLLPITPEQFEPLRRKTWPTRSLPTFTMERERLVSALVRQYLFVALFRACAESLASENASRIASMQAAERNIRDRLAELQSDYNHRRQTSITEELLDVVTGFEALTQGRR